LPGQDWVLIVGYEGNAAAVTWQMQRLIAEIGVGWPMAARVDAPCEPLWRALAELPALPEAILTFKANLLPHAVGAFCRIAASLPEIPVLQAHAGNGIVVGHIRGELTCDRARLMLSALSEAAAVAQGNVIVLRCPPSWKTALPVWGRPRRDAALMRAVRDKLDPRRIFNPGRLLGL
jgi:glycolate oxidase FAD binding subunit